MSSFEGKVVIDALQRVLPDQEPIALHEPEFAGNEWPYVKECLDTGWVSSAGSYVDRFEEMLANYTGVKRAVAVVNGTAALHVALRLAGVQEGDEVLVPALTFVATANAVAYCGAVPHFIDSEMATLGIDPDKLDAYLDNVAASRDGEVVNQNTGRPLRAVIAMHAFGHPVDLDPLAAVCDRHGLALVEDAAEALGSLYKGEHVGRWGRLSTLSFNGNKTITTGGGGAILTDDDELADQAKHLTTTAKAPHRWAYMHDQLGYNYRLPNINAALGCAQLEQLPSFLERKRRLAQHYADVFEAVDGVSFVQEPSFARSNYWLNALLLDEAVAERRDEVLELTNDGGYMTRPAWRLMHRLPMYRSCPRMDLRTAERLEQALINIPSSASLVSPSKEAADA
jgi:perosamine synthetase